MDDFLIQDGQTVVFIGDSITGSGKADAYDSLGTGYVKVVHDLIVAKYPHRSIHIINRGIGGNHVGNLTDRWHDDVIAHRPDWVSILVGINDTYKQHVNDPGFETIDTYLKHYENILERTVQQTDAKLVLLDPFYISSETKRGNVRFELLNLLPQYLQAVKSLADRFDAIHIPLQDVFQSHLQHRTSNEFCPEAVHPNATGHTIVALTWLNHLGW